MNESKQVAVLVRRNQEEALRVAAGLTLAGNGVDVYVLDRPLDMDDVMADQLEMLELADIALINVSDDEAVSESTIDSGALSERILCYDAVITI